MFDQTVPMFLQDVTFSTEKRDAETRKVVGCKWRIDPFTAEMAEALGVFDAVFADDNVVTITLELHEGLQRLSLRMAPDQTKPSIQIPDVKIGGTIKITRQTATQEHSATFRTFFDYPEAATLLVLCHGVTGLHFATFEKEQLDLPTEPSE